MKVLKGSTKAGQNIIARGEQWIGDSLAQVYTTWSQEKQDEYDKCYQKYLATPEHSAWGICSKNTWQFTVSWVGLFNGENALFYETASNSYIVLLDK